MTETIDETVARQMTDTETILAALGTYDFDASHARMTAGMWHDGQWSRLYSYASTGYIGTDRAGLVAEIDACVAHDETDAALLAALRYFIDREVSSVSGTNGHRFLSSDDRVQCLRCGALYDMSQGPDDPTDGRYVNMHGDEPNDCTGDTSMSHGYPNERVCVDDCEDGECEHCSHDCDCLLCDS